MPTAQYSLPLLAVKDKSKYMTAPSTPSSCLFPLLFLLLLLFLFLFLPPLPLSLHTVLRPWYTPL